jgi:hypothetical protein
MQPAFGHATRNKRDVVALQPGINKKTVCEIYDAVRKKNDQAIVRAGSDGQGNYYVYMPKHENPFAALTYKAASIRNHRESLANLLDQSGKVLLKEQWLFNPDKLSILQLSRLSMKDVSIEDFNAGELKSHLKPLNDRVRARDRLVKKKELDKKFSPIPKKPTDYFAQFLKKSPADQSILRQALFPKGARISLAEERAIMKSVDTLLHTYLNHKDNKQTLVSLIRKSPQQDLLLRFAHAWLNYLDRSQEYKSGNLLLTFSWEKSMSSLARSIEKHAKPVGNRHLGHLPVSPERSGAIARMFERSNAYADISEAELFSPFKPRQQSDAVFDAYDAHDAGLTSLPSGHKKTAAPTLMENSIGSELEIVSLPEETSEEVSWSEEVSRSEESGLMKVTEGPYTVYGEMPERLNDDSLANQ